MARNSHQILGWDLRSPVDLVVAWTPDGAENEKERSHATGGTGQTIALASRWKIPVFNLARPDAMDRLGAFLAQKDSTSYQSGVPRESGALLPKVSLRRISDAKCM